MHEQVLIRVDRIRELVHLEERVPNVPHDLEADGLHVVRNLVQCHAVHLDGGCPLLLLEVDIAHVHTEAPAEGILLVLHDLRVNRQRLIVVVVGLVLDGQVQADRIGEVDIELVEELLLLAEATQLPLLLTSLLALLQSLPELSPLARDGALLHKPVDLLLHLAQLLLRRHLCLLLQRLRRTAVVALIHRVEDLALLARSRVAGRAVRGHRPGCLRVAGAETTAPASRHGRHPAAASHGRGALHVSTRRRLALHMVEVVL
mmetsp:Transcript_31972/g.68065  ORF Transcript_31972/g.68065 Transcript_31972/m.68065 type:complete len:260 (-) Transcript_31972:147-926(-)